MSLKQSSLQLYAGEDALAHIRENGLRATDIRTILGPSSGPKWLVLQGLDEYLIQHFLKNLDGPINLLGTSAGAWRMASFAHQDAIESHRALTRAYIDQRYSKKPSPAEIQKGCERILSEMFLQMPPGKLLDHDVYRLNVIATQCKYLSASQNPSLSMLGYGFAALANKLTRRSLKLQFTRVLLRHPLGGLFTEQLNDLPTRYVDLSDSNAESALLASAAIPMIIKGVEDLAGKGVYQDGGITDYAFDLPFQHSDGFVLFPHFTKYPIPGWFDKAWISKRRPWRLPSRENYRKVIMLVPSESFVGKLPFGKIPDRHDFIKMDDRTRISFWEKAIDKSRYLADELDTMNTREAVKPLPW